METGADVEAEAMAGGMGVMETTAITASPTHQ